MNAIFNYFRESKRELFKVSWPTRKQTMRQSALVLVVAVATAAFLGGLDWLFNYVLQIIL